MIRAYHLKNTPDFIRICDISTITSISMMLWIGSTRTPTIS